MSAGLQEIIVLALVALAAGWLGLRLWRQARGKSSGGSCPGCNECGRPSAAPKATPLITLSAAPRPKPPTSAKRDA